ncbi:hypothetical protein MU483_14360 [Staphylococcus aureus]|uniref:hypothetical protein n=1 Tax=Staphylococcus aureus TaxID=1280 RepID=UPI001FD62D5D|nr:hypothetical protein [Staphylococcus aureus]MCJ8005837.1 hypothetical protein [Staphylococcus aureus]
MNVIWSKSVSANRTFFDEVTDVIRLVLSSADVAHADALAVSRQVCRRIKSQFGGSTIYLPTNRSKAGGHASKLGMELLDLVEDELSHQLRQAALLDELELAAATEDVRQELLLDAALFASTYPAGNGMPPWQEHYRLIPTFRTTRAGAKSRRC